MILNTTLSAPWPNVNANTVREIVLATRLIIKNPKPG